MKESESFIGKQVCISDARNTSLKNMEGKIVDENKFSFTIEVENSRKVVLKKGTTFDFDGATITGDSIIGRSDQRLKSIK